MLLALILYFAATDYFVFPVKLKTPLLMFLIILVCVSGFTTMLANGKGVIAACVLNFILITCIVSGLLILPYFEFKVKNIFVDQSITTSVMNFYSLNDDGREHIEEYSDALFIAQTKTDVDNQNYAVELILNEIKRDKIDIEYKEDIISAAKALYQKQGDLLILNEVYANQLEEIEGFEDFENDTKIIYTVSRENVSEAEPLVPVRTNITDTPFTIYIAGCDTRSGRLTTYGRTDVNLIVNINPNTKQILIIGLPRDTYIPNPALDYGYDKLTHLGNNGIYNTTKGISEYYDIEINYYGEVIFNSFKNIINAVKGIDVDNPYYFTAWGPVNSVWTKFEYPSGKIHLDGDAALAYVRERKSLPNGDYDRSEHQILVLKSFINEVISPDIINNFGNLLNSLQGQFMTDVDVDDIFKLVNMQINDGGNWDIITYHLGGIGDMCGTASMGWDWKLYVVHPLKSQITFVKKQIELLKRDEIIIQEVLPQDDETTYIPN